MERNEISDLQSLRSSLNILGVILVSDFALLAAKMFYSAGATQWVIGLLFVINLPIGVLLFKIINSILNFLEDIFEDIIEIKEKLLCPGKETHRDPQPPSETPIPAEPQRPDAAANQDPMI